MGGIDHYTLDDGYTLKNRLGITDYKYLNLIEEKLTGARLIQLQKQPVKGNYDFEHLKKIHRHLYQDLYDWAGQTRDVSIGKGQTIFCLPQHIDSYADHIFRKLKQNNHLKDLSSDQFPLKAAYIIAELNELHPFREGNGRTQREFFRQLAEAAGYKLDLNFIPKEQMILACREAHAGKYQDFEMIIRLNMKEIV